MKACDATCRSCGHAGLISVLSLGRMPLANGLLRKEELLTQEACFPLEMARCPECTLAQITFSAPPEAMFGDYPYFSSFSDTMVAHAQKLAGHIMQNYELGTNSRVVEAASNDGYLLQFYARSGVPVLGIEPAANVAEVARRERHIPTEVAYFGTDTAQDLRQRGIEADIFHAHNVLAHVPDLNGFVEAIRMVLAPKGVAVIEVPYLREMLDRVEFDTIYHEHLCYFSLTALTGLFERHRLAVTDVIESPIHGGSLQLYIRREGVGERTINVKRLLAEERIWGVDRGRAYEHFADRSTQACVRVQRLLENLHETGRRVAAYGAAAKGITLLNACGVTDKDIEFVADRNPHKQGRWLPGSRIPVVSPDAIFDTMPDDVIILPWNLTQEISRSLMGYVAQGGRLWTLIPAPRVVNCALEDFDFDKPEAVRGFGLEGHTASYGSAALQEVVAA